MICLVMTLLGVASLSAQYSILLLFLDFGAQRGIITSSITYPAEKIRMDCKFLRINSEFAKLAQFVKILLKIFGGGIFLFLGGWGVSHPPRK